MTFFLLPPLFTHLSPCGDNKPLQQDDGGKKIEFWKPCKENINFSRMFEVFYLVVAYFCTICKMHKHRGSMSEMLQMHNLVLSSSGFTFDDEDEYCNMSLINNHTGTFYISGKKKTRKFLTFETQKIQCFFVFFK